MNITSQAQAVFASLQGNRFALDILKDHALGGAAQLAIFKAEVCKVFALSAGLPENTGLATMQKLKVAKVSTFYTYCQRLGMFHKGADGFKGVTFYVKNGKTIEKVERSIETVTASELVSNQVNLKALFDAQESGAPAAAESPDTGRVANEKNQKAGPAVSLTVADAMQCIITAHQLGGLSETQYEQLRSIIEPATVVPMATRADVVALTH